MILKNLRIKNFRLFENLEFKRLGRINLLVGRNNAGKSTVLEALRIYAKVGSPGLLKDLLKNHDEVGGDKGPFWFEGFFPDGSSPKEGKTPIYIGNFDEDDYLTMKYTHFVLEEPSTANHGDLLGRLLQRRQKIEVDYQDISKYDSVKSSLKIDARNSRLTQPPVRNQLEPPGIFHVWVDYSSFSFDEHDYEVGDRWLKEHKVSLPCSYVPTGLISSSVLADVWDKIPTRTDIDHQQVIEALRLINPDLEALSFQKIGENSSDRVPVVRIGKVKSEPLNRSGDGLSRLLQLVLSMIQAEGGFLLIDEFENGLHYSVQPRVWQLLMELATKLDVQVFATTHSWDCVTAFQEGIAQSNETESMLFHLGRSALTSDQGKVVATAYDKEELELVSQVNLEVR